MIPSDYEERIYAGVLGKMIGVYLGRPVEGWTYERISRELGEIRYYIHDRLNKRLVVTDDDLAGTFIFLRSLPEHGYRPDLTPAEIGRTWLNAIIEGRTILWWGGAGNSTEHTAYLRLKSGIPAPQSGSAALNGKMISEQIGAQIFIDGWGMVSPGDPERASDLAKRAASVSHDGEAVYAAQVLAAMEAQAFTGCDLGQMLDGAVRCIPREARIYRLIDELREQREKTSGWRAARAWLARHYGYDQFPGNCPIFPNHGLVILSLLYGEDDFQKSLLIANTSGWDTDCNSGNVGCLLGIKNGLAGIDRGPDWRGPIADRLFLPSADGGQAITDAVRVTYFISKCGRAFAGEVSIAPKDGARFHFELPGSVQGFRVDHSQTVQGRLELANVPGHSGTGQRSLAFRYSKLEYGEKVRAGTATFILPEDLDMPGYELIASPTLYPGQIVRAGLSAGEKNAQPACCRLYCRSYGAGDQLTLTVGPDILLLPGETLQVEWRVEVPALAPIAEIGLEIAPRQPGDGEIFLDYLTWSGTPEIEFSRPPTGETIWRRAWVDAVDRWVPNAPESFRLVQNRGTGMLIQGTQEWTDTFISASVTPQLASSAGIAARVQGLRRYYALLLRGRDTVCLVKVLDDEVSLAGQKFPWEFGQTVELALEVKGSRLRAWVDSQPVFDLIDEEPGLVGGGIALVIADGCLSCDRVCVKPEIEAV